MQHVPPLTHATGCPALRLQHIKLHHPPACNVTIRELGFKAKPFVAQRDSAPMAAAAKVGYGVGWLAQLVCCTCWSGIAVGVR